MTTDTDPRLLNRPPYWADFGSADDPHHPDLYQHLLTGLTREEIINLRKGHAAATLQRIQTLREALADEESYLQALNDELERLNHDQS